MEPQHVNLSEIRMDRLSSNASPPFLSFSPVIYYYIRSIFLFRIFPLFTLRFVFPVFFVCFVLFSCFLFRCEFFPVFFCSLYLSLLFCIGFIFPPFFSLFHPRPSPPPPLLSTCNVVVVVAVVFSPDKRRDRARPRHRLDPETLPALPAVRENKSPLSRATTVQKKKAEKCATTGVGGSKPTLNTPAK